MYQLLSIYDDFCKSFDSEITAKAIFFDISKAFDKVWHRGLLRKLQAIGIRGTSLVRKPFGRTLTGCGTPR